MAKTITMPKLGVTMDEGKIVEWKKPEGSLVRSKDLLVIIESDKVALEYESPESGVLVKILVKPGDSVAVGQPICLIAEPGEKLEAVLPGPAPLPSSPSAMKPAVPPPAVSGVPLAAEEAKTLKVVPLVRKLAEELGISLNEVTGTGPGGRITKDDLLKIAEERKQGAAAPRPAAEKIPAPSAGERRVKTVIPLTGTRGTIAKRMTASFQNPQGTQFRDIDMTETLALRDLFRESIERETGQKLTLTALLVKALVQALREFPFMNSIIEDGQMKLVENINMGVASAIEEGLVVPVIHNVQGMSLGQIVTALAALTQRARSKKLTMADVTGGTFTITNMGMYQAEHFTPLLNPPEAAILAVGAIQKKPAVVVDAIQIRPILPLSLAMDHRGIDGAPAAQFFARLKTLLETPGQQRVRIVDIAF
jgi:pyruvate dehydrogenase E2 component (dihydrolipoamide acetyltransferase)